jgi:hypothetical protein
MRLFSGILSLLLVLIALTFGNYIIFEHSALYGYIHLMIILTSFLIVLYSFCAKCPCRLDNCGHYFPGKLTLLLPKRTPGKYTVSEFFGTTTALAAMIGFPQFWLLKNINYFSWFWTALLIAAILIRTSVCPACDNKECPGNNN